MEFNIVIEKDNPLFQRKEVEGTIKSEIAPSKIDVTKELSTRYKVPEENIVIDTIDGRFGAKEFLLVAQIYQSKEAKDSTETKTKKQRDAEIKATEEAKKAEEEAKAAAETPKEEAKSEENKTEASAKEESKSE